MLEHTAWQCSQRMTSTAYPWQQAPAHCAAIFNSTLLLCRAALRPRLLVPIGLAAAMWAFNQQTDGALSLRDEGCLLLGFLSYKVRLFVLIGCSRRLTAYLIAPNCMQASQFLAVWDSNQSSTEPSLPPRPMKDLQSERDELTLEQVLANIASVRTLKQKSSR